jgi:hypothetical protein
MLANKSDTYSLYNRCLYETNKTIANSRLSSLLLTFINLGRLSFTPNFCRNLLVENIRQNRRFEA